MNNTVETCIALYQAGEAAAAALEVGSLFTGAFGAASAAGLVDERERSLFTSGYIDALHAKFGDSVPTDMAYRIVEAT